MSNEAMFMSNQEHVVRQVARLLMRDRVVASVKENTGEAFWFAVGLPPRAQAMPF